MPWDRHTRCARGPVPSSREGCGARCYRTSARAGRRPVLSRCCRRSCCSDCSRSGRWCSRDRSAVRPATSTGCTPSRPDPWQLRTQMVRATQVRDHVGAAALCAVPARVRTRLLGWRAHRAARPPVRPRHLPPTSRSRPWTRRIDGWSTPACAATVTLLRGPSTSLGAQGRSTWWCCRRSATTWSPPCCATLWTARCRCWRRARPSWPRTGDTPSPSIR